MKIHLILNSHLDPVWLWKREQGIDKVLGTAYTACNLLERYPDIHMTRGEAWFYETVERIDPGLFARIRKWIELGRWHVVGGFYVQPDCNFPSAETFRRHALCGTHYFNEKFGVKIHTGYHVDSFGHCASMPDFLAEAGMTNYIMMRPSPAEMDNPPPSFFNWTSQNGHSVRTFRISRSYASDRKRLIASVRENIDAALADADPELGHTMCFIGVGDHGGGPVPQEIEYLLEHRNDWADAELEFSHPDACFDAIREKKLPEFRGELQHHAIGCYTAVSRIKREFVQTEDLLSAAESFIPSASGALEPEWKKLFFASFHDLLPGTSIRPAYEDIYADLGAARSAADSLIVECIRRKNRLLPEAPEQRLIFDNTSETSFSGLMEVEPWVGNRPPFFSLSDENGQPVVFQDVSYQYETPVSAILFPLNVPPLGRRILSLKFLEKMPLPTPSEPRSVQVSTSGLELDECFVTAGKRGLKSLKFNGFEYIANPLCLNVFEDLSDTWSHGLSAYTGTALGCFEGDESPWTVLESGPLRGRIASGLAEKELFCRHEISLDRETGIVRLFFRINWNRSRQMLKLCVKPSFAITHRMDFIPGGILERSCNGKEYPFHRAMLLKGATRSLAIVSRDVFAADVQPDGTLRLTLLRSPYYAHHDPTPLLPSTPAPVTDQGEFEFHLSLIPLDSHEHELELIESENNRLRRAVRFSEVTHGMNSFS